MLEHALAHLGQARALAHRCYRIPVADLDDVIQDALLGILTSRTDWSRVSDPGGYWLACVANEARVYWTRGRGKRRMVEVYGKAPETAPAPAEDPEASAVAWEMVEELAAACRPAEAATLARALRGETRKLSSGERVRLLRLRRRARQVWSL